MKRHSQRFVQKWRFVMILPVLVMPFLTMIFWALGGGQGTAASTTGAEKAGLNPELPNAQFDDDINDWDKLSLYQKAQRDSIKFNEAKRNDPYFRLPALKGSQDTIKPYGRTGNVNPSLGKKEPWVDGNEERVNEKLAELHKNLNTTTFPERKPRYESRTPVSDNSEFNSDVEKLESMMEMMQTGGAEDEEMREIQSVLDKILDIQHPERVKERIKEQWESNPGSVFHVSIGPDRSIGLMKQPHSADDSNHFSSSVTNRFYGLDETNSVSSAPETFEAEIYGAQTLISGSVIKLKLINDIYVNGILIPKNHFVHGVCALNGERLNVQINSIRYGHAIFPVSLSVYDLDGLEGIYIPGAIAREVVRQSSNQAIQDVQLNSLNPSLEAQAASAGIETAKNLIRKKTRLIKVTVKAGYKVLLVDTSNK